MHLTEFYGKDFHRAQDISLHLPESCHLLIFCASKSRRHQGLDAKTLRAVLPKASPEAVLGRPCSLFFSTSETELSSFGLLSVPLWGVLLGSFPILLPELSFPWPLASLQPQLLGSRALIRHCRLGNPEGGFNLLSPQRSQAGPEPGRGRGQGT